MRTIIAGSRNFQDYALFCEVMFQYRKTVSVVICGEANGPDKFGRRWAATFGIPVESYPADWSQGKGAGKARNEDMGKIAEQLIDFWDGESPGSRHMIGYARSTGIKTVVVNVRTKSSGTFMYWTVESVEMYG